MRDAILTASILACVTLAGCGSPNAQPVVPPPPAPAPSPMPAPAPMPATPPMPAVPAPAAAEPKIRKFTFHYAFQIKDLQPTGDAAKDVVRVWLPLPPSTDCQEVKRLAATAPAEPSEHEEARFHNRLLHFETAIPADGTIAVDVPYEVVRREVLRAGMPPATPEKLDDAGRTFFLAADKLVPTSGRPLKLLEAVQLKQEPLHRARQLYDLVDQHVAYKKEGTGWGRGDTNWVCDNGYGNCTDFHSLFISLARSQGLPARFEIGFSIPTDKPEGPIAGYHCWAWFYLDGRGWTPVDISEADKHPELKEYYFGNLTADRVLFSVGRDLELVPRSAGPPMNFFIYPYIEVGGLPLRKENVELKFSFKDA